MNDMRLCACDWRFVGLRRDLVPNSGVVALLEGIQIALFHIPQGHGLEDRIYAIENRDPRSGANVVGRGIVGDIGGELVVASPLYKQHFRLEDGQCLEFPDQRLRTWKARLNGDAVEVEWLPRPEDSTSFAQHAACSSDPFIIVKESSCPT